MAPTIETNSDEAHGLARSSLHLDDDELTMIATMIEKVQLLVNCGLTVTQKVKMEYKRDNT